MAESEQSGRKRMLAQQHRGLGRGLGALIGTEEPTEEEHEVRPVDILFPSTPRKAVTEGRRISSDKTRELLNSPFQQKKSSKTKVKTKVTPQYAESGMATLDFGDSATLVTPENINVSRETLTDMVEDHEAAPKNDAELESGRAAEELLTIPGVSFGEIPTEQIIANTKQPREVFDPEELAELAASIIEVGVLQPVVVRPIDTSLEPSETLRRALEDRPHAKFELVMGERRLRASELAGKQTIPAIIRRTDDGDLLRDALLENLHRSQLNPLEEANAYQQLMADFGATQEQLSAKIARSRPQIANTLRLLKLPPTVQRKVAAGVISAGHARALLGLHNTEDMETLADRVVAEGLSVRTLEELVKLGQIRRPVGVTRRKKAAPSAVAEEVAHQLSERWDTRVTVTEGKRKGKIVIEFAGREDLERLAGLIMPPAAE